MLKKCLIGPLVQTPKEKKKSGKRKRTIKRMCCPSYISLESCSRLICISGTGSYKTSLSLLAPPTPVNVNVKPKDDADNSQGKLKETMEQYTVLEIEFMRVQDEILNLVSNAAFVL